MGPTSQGTARVPRAPSDPSKEIFDPDFFVDPADDLSDPTGTSSVGRRSAPLGERFHIDSICSDDGEEVEANCTPSPSPRPHSFDRHQQRAPGPGHLRCQHLSSRYRPSAKESADRFADMRRSAPTEKKVTFSTFLESPKMATVGGRNDEYFIVRCCSSTCSSNNNNNNRNNRKTQNSSTTEKHEQRRRKSSFEDHWNSDIASHRQSTC